ncbi:MAG TPA: hypothetical protein VMF53_03730 [Alphaproteobacteria bacterium]|nr:hypothetical protein [Alphaproteobacteria bacterium]
MAKWIWTFVGICLAAILATLGALWAFSGFKGLGLGLEGTVALVGGVTLTIALGVGLMALVFASDKFERDQEVYRLEQKHDGPPPPAPTGSDVR